MSRGSVAPSGVDQIIGERVHIAMWRAGVTQLQLAKAIGVDQGSVSKRLRGITAWRVQDVNAAARLCGVTVEALLPTSEELDDAAALTTWKVSDLLVAARLSGLSVEGLMSAHDELGHVGVVTRGNAAAESRCTPARANRTSLERAAQAWGLAGVIAGEVAA